MQEYKKELHSTVIRGTCLSRLFGMLCLRDSSVCSSSGFRRISCRARKRLWTIFRVPGEISLIDFASFGTQPQRLNASNLSEKKELCAELALPKNAFVVAHVGRVALQRNHDFTFSVADSVLESCSNFHFVFCGRGLEKTYRPSLAGTEWDGRLHLLERRCDILDILSIVDAFLFPSLVEGMPKALVEAMAAGCPCIASNMSPIREIFPPHYSQYLVGASPDHVGWW